MVGDVRIGTQVFEAPTPPQPTIFLYTKLSHVLAQTSLWPFQLKNGSLFSQEEGHHPASLDLCRTCRGCLTLARDRESNAPLKSLVRYLQPFFSLLAIYHDHLSMPTNIITHHPKKKKKGPVSRLSREDKCFRCANSSTVYMLFCNAGKLFSSYLSI